MYLLKSLAAMAILMTAVCDRVSAQTNNNFASRAVIGSAGGTVSGSNVGATKEAGEPDHAGEEGGSSVWWTWTPATSGTAVIITEGSDFDTVLGVYTGASVGALAERASDDDGGTGTTSRVSFSANAGTAYQIAVDGFGGDSGSISLTVTPPIVVTSYTITLSASPGEGGTLSGGGAYADGLALVLRVGGRKAGRFWRWRSPFFRGRVAWGCWFRGSRMLRRGVGPWRLPVGRLRHKGRRRGRGGARV